MKKVLLFVFSVIILDAMGPCVGSHRHDEPDELSVSVYEVQLGNQQGESSEITVLSNLQWTITTADCS